MFKAQPACPMRPGTQEGHREPWTYISNIGPNTLCTRNNCSSCGCGCGGGGCGGPQDPTGGEGVPGNRPGIPVDLQLPARISEILGNIVRCAGDNVRGCVIRWYMRNFGGREPGVAGMCSYIPYTLDSCLRCAQVRDDNVRIVLV